MRGSGLARLARHGGPVGGLHHRVVILQPALVPGAVLSWPRTTSSLKEPGSELSRKRWLAWLLVWLDQQNRLSQDNPRTPGS